MKINEVTKINEAAPTTFTPTHYGGIAGANNVMLHTDGNLYFQKQRDDGQRGTEIVRWNGNPSGEGILGRFNPATIKGTIVNGQRVPYPAGTNFTNAPSAAAPTGAPTATPTAVSTTPTGGLLRRGNRGEEVKQLQRDLGMTGDEIDGIFGPATERAVKTFQQTSGSKVDGLVGPETRAAIAKYQGDDDDNAATTGGDDAVPTDAVPPLDAAASDPEAEPEAATEPAPTGTVSADTIRNRLSGDEAQTKFDDQMDEFGGDLLKMLVDAKKQSDDFWQRPQWRTFYEEVFGINVSGGRVEDDPAKGIIDINSVPDSIPRTTGRGASGTPDQAAALLGQIRYKTLTQAAESRILQLAGVNMKKVNEANMNISVNGDSASEVAELLRIMQLAGTNAKEVGIDDISQKMLPSPMDSDDSCDVCGGDHGPENLMACAGGRSSNPSMGDTIRMISAGEEAYEEVDGGFGDATTEPDDEYMRSNAGDVSDMIPSGDDLHKEKGSYPATAGGDNPMNTKESIHAILSKALAEKKKSTNEAAKPDKNDNGIPDYAEDGKGPNDLAKDKRWKQTSMSPEDAIEEFGKENVRVKKGALNNGNDMVSVRESQEVAEYDVPSNFENKHKDINNLGRKMMAMSELDKSSDDTSLMFQNAYNRLGEVLAEFGGNGFAANNLNDVIKKSALSKEIVQMLMKKAKAAPDPGNMDTGEEGDNDDSGNDFASPSDADTDRNARDFASQS